MANTSKHNRMDILVGCAMIIGFLYFGYLTMGWITRDLLGAGGYVVYADFASAGGLHVGDPVEVAGVEVGSVESVNLVDYQARTALRIRENVTLRADAVASIERDWFIGDRTISIDPGDSAKSLGPGDEIKRTESPPSIQQLVGELFASRLISR